MSFLQAIWTDLREKRLWPVAVALLVAIVAVPVVLAQSAAPTAPPPSSTPNAANPSQSAKLAVINVETTTGSGALKGASERDPFIQQVTTTTTTTTGGSTTAPTGTTGTTGATGSTGSTGGGTSTGTGTGGSVPPAPTTTPTLTPNPPFVGLTSDEAYHVTLAITDSSGGFDTIDPLPRLSLLPSDHEPLLIELGVLKGAHRVLFAVQPGTVVSGPGTCTPGPIDCQILSLAEGQTEHLSMQSPTGVVSVALFAVTGITTDQYSSAAAADAARRSVSAAGLTLLNKSTLNALSLFSYDPSLGAVVDLRNLTVGGS
ncbi:MAG TPA: hypothetical protein VMU39_30190 [Solirubrobacteraceae bacterium]|nr:hypothetical protein [Solirubrobacteraceae bacterium]